MRQPNCVAQAARTVRSSFFRFFPSPSLPHPHAGTASSFGCHIRFSLARQQLERARGLVYCAVEIKFPFTPLGIFFFFPTSESIDAFPGLGMPSHSRRFALCTTHWFQSHLAQGRVLCSARTQYNVEADPSLTQEGQRGWHLNQACQKYRTKPTSIHSASQQRSYIVWQLLHGDEPTTIAFIQPSQSLFHAQHTDF